MAETKSHLIRINDKQITDSKTPGVKKVGIGLMAEDGTKKLGSIYVTEKAISQDKKTAELPAHMHKSYVALSPGKEYNFVSGHGDTYKTEKISGQDILDQNRAYMKDLNASRTKALENGVAKEAPEMGQQAGMEA